MAEQDGAAGPGVKPIVEAKTKASSVQADLAVAGAELHLTNTALERNLPPQAKQGDVQKALDQSGAVEQKVNEAAEELAEVTELLEEEIEQREQLEAELARRPPAPPF